MTNDEMTKLAREYAEENGDDTVLFIGVRNVLSWLLRTHCIVSKEKVSEDKKFKPVEYEPIGCKNYPDIMDALGAQLTRKYERPYYDKRSETIKHIKV